MHIPSKVLDTSFDCIMGVRSNSGLLGSKVLKNPLISIYLCLVCKGQLLRVMRINEPLKGRYFIPRGRIHKKLKLVSGWTSQSFAFSIN